MFSSNHTITLILHSSISISHLLVLLYTYISSPILTFNLMTEFSFFNFMKQIEIMKKRTSQAPAATFAPLARMSPRSLLCVHLVARVELFLLLTKAIPHVFCTPEAPAYPKCFPSNSPLSPPFLFPSLHMSTGSVSSA